MESPRDVSPDVVQQRMREYEERLKSEEYKRTVGNGDIPTILVSPSDEEAALYRSQSNESLSNDLPGNALKRAASEEKELPQAVTPLPLHAIKDSSKEASPTSPTPRTIEVCPQLYVFLHIY